jgi:SAM-dependent methyltransferase
MSKTKEWFEDWFSSPYYDILYAHRDESEAELFLHTLLSKFHFPPKSRFWDLACGKGRHALFLANKGFEVTGTDLSAPFIEYARQFSMPGLNFLRQDMRADPPAQDFDCVLNLFTAFGYFSDPVDDLTVLNQVYKGLKPGGCFVLDYLNPNAILRNLIPSEELSFQDLHIDIFRKVEGQRILKEIHIEDGTQVHHYLESVQCLFPKDFEDLFEKSGFQVRELWGDYQGGKYQPELSPRQIWICNKPE